MNRLLPILLLLFFSFTVRTAYADRASLQKAEDSLRIQAKKLFRYKTDEARNKANALFTLQLENVLKMAGSFDYGFDSLTDVGKLKAPDATFKIYEWNLQRDDGSMVYFGFIQHLNTKTNKTDLFPLTDRSAEIKNAETQSLDCKKWFGALYYKIIRTKSGKNVYYTLLAWDGHNNLTWRKLIEVLWFDREGTPHFGETIFAMGKTPKKRVVFEFRAEMIMALKYNEEKEMIIFDNLAPESPEGKGIYENYVMDGSYNGLIFKKGKWQLINDVNALNPKTPNDKFYEDPRGESTKKGSNKLEPEKKKITPDAKTSEPKKE
jgi:hypothetical protein